VWARAWLMMILSLAIVIGYTLPSAFEGPGAGMPILARQVGRFGYSFFKVLVVAAFVIGTRLYATGAQSRAAYVWATLLAAVVGTLSAVVLDLGTRAMVVQAPVIVAAFAFCGHALLTLPHSRRSLGSRVTGTVFGVLGAVWIVWFVTFAGDAAGLLPPESLFQRLAVHDGYVDALLQMMLGSGMVVMLMEDAKREADDARAELSVAHDKLRRDALYDSLTGSLNRRAFVEGVGLESARATFGAVVVLDMDNLKTVNDTAGHAGGDELLQHLATTLRGVIRSSDRLYRWGGDEFLLLFPGAKSTEVQARVEQAIAEAEPLAFAGVAEPVSLVASVGSADYISAEDLAAAIERADGVMYRQKKARRTKEREVRAETPAPEQRFVKVGE
jgi:diguanylate cyclase (GGDEF)-like protein